MWQALSSGPIHGEGPIRLAVVKQEPGQDGPEGHSNGSGQALKGVEKPL